MRAWASSGEKFYPGASSERRMLLDLALTVPGAHMGHGAQAGT